MADTFEQIAGKVLARCESVGILLARDFVKNAFRRLTERRDWSWRRKSGQFVIPAVYSAGTIAVTRDSPTVTGTNTVWDASMTNRQFRSGSNPVYTVNRVVSATSLELDQAWGGVTASGQSYEIYQSYFTTPSDFDHFLTVWDPALNWQLHLHYQQEELNLWDAQRTNAGDPVVVAGFDFSQSYSGTVAAVVQALGTGPDPVSTGTYTGPSDALFVVECTTGGVVGVSDFRWKKNGGSYTSGVLTDSNPQDLADGVQIYWPADTYVLGDIWIIRVSAIAASGNPRYELWPHRKTASVIPFMYFYDPKDLDETGMVLPRNVRGDILLEMALAECAAWPGTSDKRNPYYDLLLARRHDSAAEKMIQSLEVGDDEIFMRDLVMQRLAEMPYATLPMSAEWQQSHAIY